MVKTNKQKKKIFILKNSENCYQQATNWEEFGKIAEIEIGNRRPTSPRLDECKEKPPCT